MLRRVARKDEALKKEDLDMFENMVKNRIAEIYLLKY